jgi:hypothetical protein
MPDLNYLNPHVVAEMENVMRFYFNLGFDGISVRVGSPSSTVRSVPLSAAITCTPNVRNSERMISPTMR